MNDPNADVDMLYDSADGQGQQVAEFIVDANEQEQQAAVDVNDDDVGQPYTPLPSVG